MSAQLRLFQLSSANLPLGGFTYSQGLEWAVECGWVHNSDSLKGWLESSLEQSLGCFDLPLLRHCYQAVCDKDLARLRHLADWVVAGRETMELRNEERQRGAALARLLPSLDVVIPDGWREPICQTQIAGFALAGHHWQLSVDELCQAYLWAWLEGAVVAGIKLVPLGQTQGQRLLLDISPAVDDCLSQSSQIPEQQIGATTFALAIASSAHETQYTRLYRS